MDFATSSCAPSFLYLMTLGSLVEFSVPTFFIHRIKMILVLNSLDFLKELNKLIFIVFSV